MPLAQLKAQAALQALSAAGLVSRQAERIQAAMAVLVAQVAIQEAVVQAGLCLVMGSLH